MPSAETATGSRRPQPLPTLGDWQLVESAGAGRFACVFYGRPRSATDERCDYVIKQLRQEHCDSPEMVDRFRREAVLGISVAHPNLVTVLSAEVEAAPFYMVMPRLRGTTAAAWIAELGRLDLPLALWIARQVAQGLSAFHAAGWLHADIKPENVFLTADGHATLLDLGLATAMGSESRRLSAAVLCGTLAYAAPESFTSTRALCAASDVYSLGVMLYQLLAGQPPFDCRTPAECAEAHLHQLPPSLRTYVRRTPREVAALVTRMMAKQPTRRPQLDELCRQLTRLEIEHFSVRQ